MISNLRAHSASINLGLMARVNIELALFKVSLIQTRSNYTDLCSEMLPVPRRRFFAEEKASAFHYSYLSMVACNVLLRDNKKLGVIM